MVLFLTNSNGSKPLIIIIKNSILDIGVVLDLPLLNVELFLMF